jgi:predicted nicotinamide N-methyase
MEQTADLERSLRERFVTREESFEEGDRSFKIILPQSAEDLLDEEAFEKDERMPYWADLWPSARALGRWVLRQTALEGRWLELGCGVGLPSVAVKSREGDILATDHNENALEFARVNVERNRADHLETALLDWRGRNPAIGKFDVIIAADVLYEQRNAVALRDLLPRVMKREGRFVLADPGRRFLQQFQSMMREAGWRDVQLATIVESQMTSKGETPSTIRMIEFTKI